MSAPERPGRGANKEIDGDMRKPLVVLGLAAVTLVAGGCTARALAHEPPDTPDLTATADHRRLYGDPGLLSPPDDPAAGWGGVSVRPVAQAPARTAAAPSSSTEEPDMRQPARRAAEAGNDGDPIAASRTAITAASVSPGVQAPVQQQVLALVNRNRREAGCDPISLDRRLVEAANRHAADMARRDYFDHESPGGARAGERVTDAGYVWRRYGENIAKGQESPYEVMTDWMNSPGHRENIVDCRLDQMGVGLALAADRTPYWVQDFATPRS
ncbi:CAP domain-containing protein [Actinoplanes sp. NPDC023801]|uniref:CAP domain-containing protein n=1 Tax=Actinoplanes sp. NPDC023801 TaxID=3154595 RepID=UPI0033F5B748